MTADAVFADVVLGAPANNGGRIETMALPPGSAAGDAGTATGAPPLDQRVRPRHGAVDIGAYELQPTRSSPPVSNSRGREWTHCRPEHLVVATVAFIENTLR